MDITADSTTILSFGEFLYTDTHGLVRSSDASVVPLSPRVSQVLVYFLERPGAVVQKHDLLDELWPGGQASENAMSRAIQRLRNALGDDARKPAYLRTDHGVGFRWIAAITHLDGERQPVPASAESGPHTVPATLTHAFTRASPLLLRAGWDARRRGEPHESHALFDLAVEGLRHTPGESAEHRRAEAEARAGLALSQLDLRALYRSDAVDNLDAIDVLVDGFGDDPALFQLHQAALLANNLAGRTGRVRDLAPVLMASAELSGRPEERMDGLHAIGEAALHRGDVAAALQMFDAAYELWQECVDNPDGLAPSRRRWLCDSGARIATARAGTALLLGRDHLVEPSVAESLAILAEGPSSQISEIANSTIAGAILHLSGRAAAATDAIDRARRAARPENVDFHAVIAALELARSGLCPDTLTRTGTALLEQPAIPFPLGPLVLLDAIARSALDTATMSTAFRDAGLSFLDDLQRATVERRTRWIDSEMLRVRGLLSRDDARVARSYLEQARFIAERDSLDFFLQRAEDSLARCA